MTRHYSALDLVFCIIFNALKPSHFTKDRIHIIKVFFPYSYMIDNIILLITGTLHQRPISELVPKCHKLGSFEQMEAIHVAATPAELYNAVLVGKLISCIPIFLNQKRSDMVDDF
jgi:vacuolar-type H+-ATPase subunit C/Vma6